MRFGMSRSAAAQLAEALEFFHGDRELIRDLAILADLPHLRQMQHGVQQHGSVAVGENEAVAVEPGRVGGIVAQKSLPQAISDRSQTHGRAGMAGVGLLYAINGESSNRVDAQRV